MQLERVAQTEPESFQLPSPAIVKVPLQQAAKALTVSHPAPSHCYHFLPYLKLLMELGMPSHKGVLAYI